MSIFYRHKLDNRVSTWLFFTALKNIALSEGKPEPSLTPQTYQVLFRQSKQEFDSLSSLLHSLGLRLTVMVEKSPTAR